jgi:hypothetical protein
MLARSNIQIHLHRTGVFSATLNLIIRPAGGLVFDLSFAAVPRKTASGENYSQDRFNVSALK